MSPRSHLETHDYYLLEKNWTQWWNRQNFSFTPLADLYTNKLKGKSLRTVAKNSKPLLELPQLLSGRYQAVNIRDRCFRADCISYINSIFHKLIVIFYTDSLTINLLWSNWDFLFFTSFIIAPYTNILFLSKWDEYKHTIPMGTDHTFRLLKNNNNSFCVGGKYSLLQMLL